MQIGAMNHPARNPLAEIGGGIRCYDLRTRPTLTP
jgi:hypothetical protein